MTRPKNFSSREKIDGGVGGGQEMKISRSPEKLKLKEKIQKRERERRTSHKRNRLR